MVIKDYAQRMLADFLESDFIPSIAGEVLKENMNNRDLTLYSANVRGDIEYVDLFIERVVKKMAREAVRETTEGIVNQ